jgi:hypothetical protein
MTLFLIACLNIALILAAACPLVLAQAVHIDPPRRISILDGQFLVKGFRVDILKEKQDPDYRKSGQIAVNTWFTVENESGADWSSIIFYVDIFEASGTRLGDAGKGYSFSVAVPGIKRGDSAYIADAA